MRERREEKRGRRIRTRGGGRAGGREAPVGEGAGGEGRAELISRV